MKTTRQKVNGFIERHAMLDGTRGVLVAVSGGPDSVALLDMLVRLSLGAAGAGFGVGDEQEAESRSTGLTNPLPPTPNPHLHVAHLDHMLRGRESAEDAEFVRALADRLGLSRTIGSVDVRAAAEASGGGIEEVAREVRYDFLLAVAAEAGCDRIAVGHTMTDQAETFLMRLIRGAGLRGLAAMRPVVPAHLFREAREQKAEGGTQKAGDSGLPSALRLLPSVSIVRPLLCITREEVEAYCRERELQFRIDATNLCLNYTRNRIRRDVLTALTAINPQVVASISRAAENIAGDEDVLDGLASSLLTAARFPSDSWGAPLVDGAVFAYSAAALLEQRAGMRRRMIIEAIRQARSGAPCEKGDDPGEVTSVHVAAVEALLRPKASGKHVALPGTVEVWREFDALVLKPGALAVTAHYQSSISQACPGVDAGGFAFRLQRALPAETLKTVIEETRRETHLTGRDWMTVALDDCALPEQLLIRPRVRGERAHVVGQRRTIKLKSLMIDHRIPSSRRATWPLVTTPNGAYIWSPGLPPALEFAAHDETQSLAIMRASATDFGRGTCARGATMEKTPRVVRSKEEIQNRISQLADEIRAVAPAGELTIVGILDDAFVFLADLVRALDIPLNCCFMKVTRHRHGGQSEVMFTSEFDPRGRDILLVAAVVATGVTLDYISEHLATRGVKSLRTCVLVDRPGERRLDVKPDFAAFQMDDGFVFGFGLGIQNQFRQLPYLAVMDE